MPSSQGGQSAIVAHYTPEELANNGVHTVKIPQDLRRAAVPDAASEVTRRRMCCPGSAPKTTNGDSVVLLKRMLVRNTSALRDLRDREEVTASMKHM